MSRIITINSAITSALDFLSSEAYRNIMIDTKEFKEKAYYYIEKMKEAGVDKEIVDYFTSICYERYAYLKEE